MRRPYTDALDKLMETTKSAATDDGGFVKKIKIETYEGVRERVDDVEVAIGLRPTDGSIYARLKAIEQRIAYLETASPEYSHFVVRKVFVFRLRNCTYSACLFCATVQRHRLIVGQRKEDPTAASKEDIHTGRCGFVY